MNTLIQWSHDYKTTKGTCQKWTGLINETQLPWKINFGTETGDVNSEGGLNLREVFIAELYCISH